MLTALFLPATLVTGFFGMNTKGLPFAEDDNGFWYAFGIAGVAAAITYFVLLLILRRRADH
jgi:Mg2+ and Co2+ transporter CorA